MKLPLNPSDYKQIVFFTGAGMSAESGVPTYRGKGGIWRSYNWEEYACQQAFERDPEKVVRFHESRRNELKKCMPHEGHFIISKLEQEHESVCVITQNIDGMHQRAGSKNVIELHGSIWRMRCREHGVFSNCESTCPDLRCPYCGDWLRPDIVWFGDMLDTDLMDNALNKIANCDLFVSIGTSAAVWPAAGYPEIASKKGALCVEINPEKSPVSHIYDLWINETASNGLKKIFGPDF